MNIIETAAGVVIGLLVVSFLSTLRKKLVSKKKAHFFLKLEQTQRAIYDLEFQKAKLKMVREDMRLQYDKIKEQSEIARRNLEEEQKKEKPDEKVVQNLTNVIEKYKPDLQYLQDQMTSVDNEVDGESNPNSLSQKIEGSITLREMLKEHIRKL